MKLGLGVILFGLLFVLIPSQVNLLLVEFLEWLQELLLARLELGNCKLRPTLLSHNGVCLGCQSVQCRE